jgi:hypothetical protein
MSTGLSFRPFWQTAFAIMGVPWVLNVAEARAHERPKTFSPPMECHMKVQSAIATLVLGAVLVSPVFAQNSQQTKMADCNKQAGDKKGDDRKAFMKTCLSAKPAAAAPMSQQDKMKACNTQAAGKKGDDRKAFMKSCLSSAPSN